MGLDVGAEMVPAGPLDDIGMVGACPLDTVLGLA